MEILFRAVGAYLDPVAAAYILGNGYRWYLPGLMRFNAPDGWSPFGPGGANPYAYCGDDPINRRDPSGHMALDGIGDIERAAEESRGTAAREASAAAIAAGPGAEPPAHAGTSSGQNRVDRTGPGHPLRVSFDIGLHPNALTGYRSMTLKGYALGIGPIFPLEPPLTLGPGKTVITPAFDIGHYAARWGLAKHTDIDLIFDLESKTFERFDPTELRIKVRVTTRAVQAVREGAPGFLYYPEDFPPEDNHRYKADAFWHRPVPDADGIVPRFAGGLSYPFPPADIDPYDPNTAARLRLTIARLTPADIPKNILPYIRLWANSR